MKKQYYIIVILTLIILGGAFYWYEVRPSQIRKGCIQITNSKFNPEKFAADLSGKNYFDDTTYKKCLIENGVKE